jgi:hypothetical protein
VATTAGIAVLKMVLAVKVVIPQVRACMRPFSHFNDYNMSKYILESTSSPSPPMDNDIITQTDKYGNSLSSAAPQMMKTEAGMNTQRSKTLPWWQIIFCCLRPKRTKKVKQRSNTEQIPLPPQPSG